MRQTSSIEVKSPINNQFKKSPNIDDIESDNQLRGNFCPNCGTQLTNTEAIYCPSCGSSLK
jgi:DNA-directed RNA polymerase subunit RPC12/RpoP